MFNLLTDRPLVAKTFRRNSSGYVMDIIMTYYFRIAILLKRSNYFLYLWLVSSQSIYKAPNTCLSRCAYNYLCLFSYFFYDSGSESKDSCEKRYSPAKCVDAKKVVVTGDPEKQDINTSYVERQDLTMHMSMRRFTRLTNGFSKKVENHMHAISLHYMYYNFCRTHRSLRVTPAMEAGIADMLYDLDFIVNLIDERAAAPKKRGPYKKRISN